MSQANFISLAVITIFLTNILNTCEAIYCYKCTTTKPALYSDEPTRLCSEFDYSDKYIVDCPFSTFCTKRFFTAQISASINATERDCAFQKHPTQKFKDGQWQPEVLIEEPYQEGCTNLDDKGLRTSKIIECHCKSELCNHSGTINDNFSLILTMAVIVTSTILNQNYIN